MCVLIFNSICRIFALFCQLVFLWCRLCVRTTEGGRPYVGSWVLFAFGADCYEVIARARIVVTF